MRVLITAMAVAITAFVVVLMLQISGKIDLSPRSAPITVGPAPPVQGRFSDYPINYELRGELGSASDKSFVVHKVTYDEARDEYVYYYRIEYKGKNDMAIVSWEVIDTTMRSISPVLVILKSGEAQEFTYHDPSPPIMARGRVYFYEKFAGDDLSHLNITATKNNFFHSMSSDLGGPIPSSLLRGKNSEPEKTEPEAEPVED